MAEQTVTQNGLVYTLSEDGTYYTVEIPSELDEDVLIESNINNIPVVYDSLDYANSKYAKTFMAELVGSSSGWDSCEGVPDGYEEVYRDGGCIYYQYEDGSHCVVTRDGNTMTEVSILSEVNGVPVTMIADYAFYNCSELTSINIPAGVTSIGYQSFWNCSALTSIAVDPDNTVYKSDDNCLIEKATNALIQGCNTSVIPNYVTSIGEYAFYGCKALTSINIPDGVTSIGWGTFSRCSGLTSITIPDSVTSIGRDAFYDCTSLTSVTIGSGVTSIEDSAFSQCGSLTSITIPNSVTSIGSNAFESCKALTSINIPDSVTSIGRSAFYKCTSLTSINIPDSVTSIERYAFQDCSALKTVILGKGLETLYGTDNYTGSFNNCTALTTVINKSDNLVTPDNTYPFYGCDSLTKIYYTSTTAGYTDGGTWCGRTLEYLNWPDDQSFMLNTTVTDSFTVTNKTTINVKEKMNYKLRYTITDTNGNRYIGDVPIGKYYLYDNTTNAWVLFPQ